MCVVGGGRTDGRTGGGRRPCWMGGGRRPCWISFLEKDFLFRRVPNLRPLNPKSDALSTELRRTLTEGRPVSQAGSTASRMRAQVEKGSPSPSRVRDVAGPANEERAIPRRHCGVWRCPCGHVGSC